MPEHTKGKLTYDEGARTIWCGEFTIADVLDTLEGLEGDCPAADANMRRLVAAWNAVEGISTEALEQGIIASMVKACNVHPLIKESPIA